MSSSRALPERTRLFISFRLAEPIDLTILESAAWPPGWQWQGTRANHSVVIFKLERLPTRRNIELVQGKLNLIMRRQGSACD